MAIPEKCSRVLALLNRIKRYDVVVRNDSFTDNALREMKQNCQEILREAGDELREIFKEVNSW